MAGTGVRISLLGPVRCLREGAAVALGGSRPTGLLAMLATRQPHPVSRAELVDGLWGDDPPRAVVNSIQVHVSALRRAVGRDTIVNVGNGYQLTDVATTDAADFSRLLATGLDELARGEAHVAARTLRSALQLWAGPALADVLDAPFATIEAARLEELRIRAATGQIEADLQLGRHHDAVPELQALVAAAPLREELREALVRVLHESGRRAEALAAYEEWRLLLRHELGLEPSAVLQALHERLLRLPGQDEIDMYSHRWDVPRQLPVHLD